MNHRSTLLRLVLCSFLLLVVSTGCASQPSLVKNETNAVSDSLWTKEELYFGMDIPNGGTISEEEWNTFVASEITPRFPDGITILNGLGQYRYQTDTITKEPTKIVVIFFREHVEEQEKAIDGIISLYKQQFHQESVLRATSRVSVKF